MRGGAFDLGRDVLIEGATAGDVDQLCPAADAENRASRPTNSMQQFHFVGVLQVVAAPVRVSQRFLPAGLRADVGPSLEDQAIEMRG